MPLISKGGLFTFTDQHSTICFELIGLRPKEPRLNDHKIMQQFDQDISSAIKIINGLTSTSKQKQLILTLLEELQDLRDRQKKNSGDDRRVIIEGFSEESMQAAFSEALSKAAGYFSQSHDISINVLGLVALPKGGYHATIEVHITPLKNALTEKPAGQDTELKHIKDLDYKTRKKEHEEALKHLVHDHFMEHHGQVADVPDYFLINIDNAETMRMMMEQRFFHATHGTDTEHTPQFVVRFHKDGPNPEPED